MTEKKVETAAEFLNRDGKDVQEFKRLCEGAGIEPTKRQVRKFRNHRGAVYNTKMSIQYLKDN